MDIVCFNSGNRSPEKNRKDDKQIHHDHKHRNRSRTEEEKIDTGPQAIETLNSNLSDGIDKRSEQEEPANQEHVNNDEI